jgi:hypothetical protein
MHHPLEGMLILSFIVLVLPGQWLTLEKTGHPGWACCVPFYNLYVLCLATGKPGWWTLLLLLPGVNLVLLVLRLHDLSRAFGYGAGMTALQLLLPWVAYPVLGFGSATYRRPSDW